MAKLMQTVATLCLGVLLSGCASMPDREDLTWYALHAIDTAQTYSVPRINDSRAAGLSPCGAVEDHPVTRRLIGERPSRGEVLAWSVGFAAARWGFYELLERANVPTKRLKQFENIVKLEVVYTNQENNVRALSRRGYGCVL